MLDLSLIIKISATRCLRSFRGEHCVYCVPQEIRGGPPTLTLVLLTSVLPPPRPLGVACGGRLLGILEQFARHIGIGGAWSWAHVASSSGL